MPFMIAANHEYYDCNASRTELWVVAIENILLLLSVQYHIGIYLKLIITGR